MTTQPNQALNEPLPQDVSEPEPPQEDDFDASEYVRDLIARMDGDESAEPANDSLGDEPDPEPVPQEVRPPSSSESSTRPAAEPQTETQPPVPAAPPPAVRRRPAPELLSDLERLREAANLTTSNALRTFDCKSLILRSYSSLAMSTVSIVLCLALVLLSEQPYSMAHWAGIIMFLCAFVATRRFSKSTSVLWRNSNPQDAHS